MITKIFNSLKLSSLSTRIMKSKDILLAGLLLIILALIILYFARNYMYRVKELDTKEGMTNSNNAEVIFFFADWCPHCKKVKDPSGSSMWDKLMASEKVKDGTIINGYAIKYVAKDCTNNKDPTTQETLEKYKVEGFPTFKISLGKEIIEYDAKPELESLERFILTTLSR